jgi:hypothetical protein
MVFWACSLRSKNPIASLKSSSSYINYSPLSFFFERLRKIPLSFCIFIQTVHLTRNTRSRLLEKVKVYFNGES